MQEKKKFELTTETKVNTFGITLFRLKALVDGKYYKKGEKGGWVESLELIKTTLHHTQSDCKLCKFHSYWLRGKKL